MGAGSSRMEYYPLMSPKSPKSRTDRPRPTPRPPQYKKPALPEPVTLSSVSLHTNNTSVDKSNKVTTSNQNYAMNKRTSPIKNRSTLATRWTPNISASENTQAIPHANGNASNQKFEAPRKGSNIWTPRPHRENGEIVVSIYSPHNDRDVTSILSGSSWKSGRPPPPTGKPKRASKDSELNTLRQERNNQSDSKFSPITDHRKPQKCSDFGTNSNRDQRQVDRWVNPAHVVNMYEKQTRDLRPDEIKRYASVSRSTGTSTRQWTFSGEWF